MKLLYRNLFPVLLLMAFGSTHALEKIPDVDGITGFLSLGGGVAAVESNFLAEALGNDLSDDNIDDRDSPSDESFAIRTQLRI